MTIIIVIAALSVVDTSKSNGVEISLTKYEQVKEVSSSRRVYRSHTLWIIAPLNISYTINVFALYIAIVIAPLN